MALYAVRTAAGWTGWRVVPVSEFQVTLFGKRKPHVYDRRAQACAVRDRLNKKQRRSA